MVARRDDIATVIQAYNGRNQTLLRSEGTSFSTAPQHRIKPDLIGQLDQVGQNQPLLGDIEAPLRVEHIEVDVDPFFITHGREPERRPGGIHQRLLGLHLVPDGPVPRQRIRHIPEGRLDRPLVGW